MVGEDDGTVISTTARTRYGGYWRPIYNVHHTSDNVRDLHQTIPVAHDFVRLLVVADICTQGTGDDDVVSPPIGIIRFIIMY